MAPARPIPWRAPPRPWPAWSWPRSRDGSRSERGPAVGCAGCAAWGRPRDRRLAPRPACARPPRGGLRATRRRHVQARGRAHLGRNCRSCGAPQMGHTWGAPAGCTGWPSPSRPSRCRPPSSRSRPPASIACPSARRVSFTACRLAGLARALAAAWCRSSVALSHVPLRVVKAMLTTLRETERLTTTLDDPRRRAWASVYVSQHSWVTGHLTEAQAFGEPAGTELLAQRPPRVVYRGGPLLRHPRIVTINFAGSDPGLASWFERSGSTITRTRRWPAAVEDCRTRGGHARGPPGSADLPGGHAGVLDARARRARRAVNRRLRLPGTAAPPMPARSWAATRRRVRRECAPPALPAASSRSLQLLDVLAPVVGQPLQALAARHRLAVGALEAGTVEVGRAAGGP